MAGPRAVVLSRQVKNGKEPRLQSCKHRRRRSAAMSKGSNDRESGERGSARLEWRAAWRNRDNGCGIEVLDRSSNERHW